MWCWGVDWMKGVSPISFYFNQMEVSFEKRGRRMTLTSGKEVATCKMITGKRLRRVLQSKWSQLIQLFQTVEVEEKHEGEDYGELQLIVSRQPGGPNQVSTLPPIDGLLMEFRDLFKEPNTFPPSRTLDHAINIKPNVEPINMRSYHYSPVKKD